MYTLCYSLHLLDPYFMTLRDPRAVHALDLPEIRHRIAHHLLPRLSDLYSCMLVSRGWYLDFAGALWHTLGAREISILGKRDAERTALLNKYGRYVTVVETKSEVDFRTLQHASIRNIKGLTVSLSETEGLMRELVSDLVRRCRRTLRRVNLQGPSVAGTAQGAHQQLQGARSMYHFDINTLVPDMESGLEEVHIHNVGITREGFSNFLRGASNLRHLRLNNVCITTFNSGVELFTESRLRRLVCSVSQVMNPGKEQSLTASATPGTSLLVHFPALQHWTVESGPSSTEFSALMQLHQAVIEYTPNLRNIQINDANSYTLTELLARVFVNLQTSSLQFSHFTSDALLSLLSHHSTLTRIQIQTRAVKTDALRTESMRSTHLILKTCAKLEVLSIRGYEVRIEELDVGEWACRDVLRELRIVIMGFGKGHGDVCLKRLQKLRNERVLGRASREAEATSAVEADVEVGGSGVADRVVRRLLPLKKLKIVCLGGKDYYLATTRH
ncbi:hypothetical protein F5H01DRAFT_354072 [Linnemannia elongata]|nr:hypothetical protein F5H01DRAFT_354072 [Linnemannia elongata]